MALAVGRKAPEFKLPGSDGKDVALSDFQGKTVVLYFYPKDDTPGCTTEACEFRDAYDRFREQGIEVIGVSPESLSSSNSGACFPSSSTSSSL